MAVSTAPRALSALSGQPYLAHFGLEDNPFRTTPNAQYTFLTNSHREAILHITHLIDGRRGLGAVTGEIGTGKTTLARTVAERAEQDGNDVAFLLRVPGAARQTDSKIYQAIADDLNLGGAQGRSAEKMLNKIIDRASALAEKGKTMLVIIDEAHKLKPAGVQALLPLLSAQSDQEQLIQVLLFGQYPEMGSVLTTDEAFHSRLAIHPRLNPLVPMDVGEMLKHRLKVAGRAEPFFTKPAIDAIYQRSRGIPRKIVTIADRGAAHAFVRNASLVDVEDVIRAANDLMHEKEETVE